MTLPHKRNSVMYSQGDQSCISTSKLLVFMSPKIPLKLKLRTKNDRSRSTCTVQMKKSSGSGNRPRLISASLPTGGEALLLQTGHPRSDQEKGLP